MERVRIDGKLWTRIDRGKEAIELPSESGTMHVEIEYR
jgi:hypothetical protein